MTRHVESSCDPRALPACSEWFHRAWEPAQPADTGMLRKGPQNLLTSEQLGCPWPCLLPRNDSGLGAHLGQSRLALGGWLAEQMFFLC